MQDNTISVILPIKSLENFKPNLLDALRNQTYSSLELIIVDASKDGLNRNKINLNGFENVKWVFSKNAFPGKARNAGIREASCEIIALLDSMTVPKSTWLEDGFRALSNQKAEFIFGKCIAVSESYFSRVVKALTYGCLSFRSLPGSIFQLKALNKIGIQVENVRAGEDIEWIQRIEYLGIKSMQPSDQNIYYYGFPNSLLKLIKKWNEYSIANAKLNILTFQKVIYFYLISILILYFLYTWNYIFTEGQWDESTSFIPNLNTISWSLLFSMYFFSRSILLPLRKGETFRFVLPFNWIVLGLTGLLMDIVKIPGRVYGLIRIIGIKIK